MKKIRLIVLTAAPLALALTLAGCAGGGNDTSMPGMDHGGGMTSSESPSVEVQGEFNAADSMFAMMMIPHHQQAVEMSDMILGKSGVDQRVLDLAQQIKDAQAPEIELMQSWLAAWGMDSAGDMSGMSGMDDGMMSEDDMVALEAADGAEAARLFLEQMIMHHQGAIEMAQAEIEGGINPDAVALAQTIVEAQTAEIASMQDLLTQI
ncbi:DUF305 domain-containing protein [Microbacterium aurum]|uniref:DUF305 domain-containing protein n=1 Tax=Microbacterium aurum TaxID=36805 RepID=UPI0028E751B3|nr:DUF305 domain-containing protein [Microbacterium aurum]